MIADRQNPAVAVYLDGQKLDLHFVVFADDSRGIVEMLEVEHDMAQGPRIKMGPCGQPVTIERRGDVRIFMPQEIRFH